MNVLVANVHVPFVRGGAEQLADDLVDALRARGHQAELLLVPFGHRPAEAVLDQMAVFRLLDLEASTPHEIDRVVALKFPAYLVDHPGVTTWLCHQHRLALDLWDAARHGLVEHRSGPTLREAVLEADRAAFGRMTDPCTISPTVSRRLESLLGVHAAALCPPVSDPDRYRCAPAEDFLFLPSRINAMKRQVLAVEALACADPSIRLVIAGDGPSSEIRDLERAIHAAGVEHRVDLLGHVDDETKVDLYARCRGVVFVPVDEDYGYIAPEAMLAAKPVVTARDSGGPVDLVVDGETGFVVEPEPEALGAAYDRLWTTAAAELGAAGRDRYPEVVASWDEIVARLLGQR